MTLYPSKRSVILFTGDFSAGALKHMFITCGEQGQQVADTIPEGFWNLEKSWRGYCIFTIYVSIQLIFYDRIKLKYNYIIFEFDINQIIDEYGK